MTARRALAAIVFAADEPVDELIAALRRELEARGVRVGGVTQTPCGDTVLATHIESGVEVDLMQPLGACAEGCRLDTAALAEVAGLLGQSFRSRPDLLLISRFGRVEAEGGGFRDEIGAIAMAGRPALIAVSSKQLDAWQAYAGDFAETLPFSLEAALAWWDAVAPVAET